MEERMLYAAAVTVAALINLALHLARRYWRWPIHEPWTYVLGVSAVAIGMLFDVSHASRSGLEEWIRWVFSFAVSGAVVGLLYGVAWLQNRLLNGITAGFDAGAEGR